MNLTPEEALDELRRELEFIYGLSDEYAMRPWLRGLFARRLVVSGVDGDLARALLPSLADGCCPTCGAVAHEEGGRSVRTVLDGGWGYKDIMGLPDFSLPIWVVCLGHCPDPREKTVQPVEIVPAPEG